MSAETVHAILIGMDLDDRPVFYEVRRWSDADMARKRVLKYSRCGDWTEDQRRFVRWSTLTERGNPMAWIPCGDEPLGAFPRGFRQPTSEEAERALATWSAAKGGTVEVWADRRRRLPAPEQV